MTRRRWLLLLVGVAACTRDQAEPPDPGPGIETWATGDITATCAPQPDNVLRWDCTFTLGAAGPLEVSWGTPGDPERRHAERADAALTHTLTLWGLEPDTEHVLVATSGSARVEGSFATEPLPTELVPDISVEGASTVDHVLATLACGPDPTLAILSTDGTVVWYERWAGAPGGPTGMFDGYQFTPARTVLAVVGGDIVETTLSGALAQPPLRSGIDFDVQLHHDVHRAPDGRTWALFAERVRVDDTDFVLDGALVFDGTERVATWRAAPFLEPVDMDLPRDTFWQRHFPGAVDFSHTNAISVDDDGRAWLSMRRLDAVWRFDADPASPDFGVPHWALVGASRSPLVGDFTLSSSAGLDPTFIGQHHPLPEGDGYMTLFDNHIDGPDAVSRGLVLHLDEERMEADVVQELSLGEACTVQGSVYPLPDGHRLLTCATSLRAVEVDPSGVVVWSMTQTCPRPGRNLPRVMPVEL